MNFPLNVARTVSFFEKYSLWHLLSRNESAFSCKDAARKRIRSSKIGIPLSDELKTYFGEHRISRKQTQLILINLPGDHRIDFEKVRSIIGAVGEIGLAPDKTMKLFQIQFGEVNPFLIYNLFEEINKVGEFSGLTILFDNSLITKQSTVMTNAGDLTWGIEFNAHEVISYLPGCISTESFVEAN
jgi:prolyl-tRNA editing enzyme YbaK/EbsC (Cys-tRNA(Pro) deacylase)